MPFSAAALEFLRELEANNDREWFQPRKDKYEEFVRGPMLGLVEQLNREFEKVAPDHATEPSKAVYRIYRDTRFSKDKTPYKTHIGALFWNRRLGKDGGAAFYFHLSTQELLIAGGVYHAMPEVLLAIRQHIAVSHAGLRSILRRKAVVELLGELQGDKLSRPPKGWTAEHPAVEFLKFKDLLLETTLPPETAAAGNVYREVATRFKAMAPFVEFLNVPLLKKAAGPRDPLMAG